MSFVATIAFAVLALLTAFCANAIGWVITEDGIYKLGVLAAIGAAALSYLSQGFYTAAEQFLAQSSQPRPPVDGAPEPYAEYLESFRAGTIARWAAIAFAAGSLIAYLLGP